MLRATKITTIKELVEYDDIQNNLNQSVFEFFATTFFNDYSYRFGCNVSLTKEINDVREKLSNKRIAFPPKTDEMRQQQGKLALRIIQKLENHYRDTQQIQNLDSISFDRLNTYYANEKPEHEAFQTLGKNLQTNFYK